LLFQKQRSCLTSLRLQANTVPFFAPAAPLAEALVGGNTSLIFMSNQL
jgi:hypothetical protein